MLTAGEEEEWVQLARRVPRSVIEGWYRGLLGCELEELHWGREDEDTADYLFFVADTMCSNMSFRDPPAWLVFRVMKYLQSVEQVSAELASLADSQVPCPPEMAAAIQDEFWNLLAGVTNEA